MLMFILATLAVFGLPLLLATSARLVVAGSGEFRVRVLETVAAAVHRGVAVDPQFLWLIAHDSRGRRRRAVLRAAGDLDAGVALSAALRRALRLPEGAAATIAAAEGTPHLCAALRATATADRYRTDFRNKLLVHLAYPALVLTCLGGFLGFGIAPKFRDVCASMNVAPGAFFRALDAAQVLGIAMLGVTAIVALSAVPRVATLLGKTAGWRRAARGREVAAWLHALSSAIGAGRPLDVALERTADAIGHPRHVRAVRAAASGAAAGDDAGDVFARLPIPAWLVARAAILTGPPPMLAATLRELAATASDRTRAAEERFLTLLTPLLLTVTGAALGMVFLTFFAMIERIRETTVPW